MNNELKKHPFQDGMLSWEALDQEEYERKKVESPVVALTEEVALRIDNRVDVSSDTIRAGGLRVDRLLDYSIKKNGAYDIRIIGDDPGKQLAEIGDFIDYLRMISEVVSNDEGDIYHLVQTIGFILVGVSFDNPNKQDTKVNDSE